MGIGVISLSTSQKREPNGAPFTDGSADNGLSVDPITKKIVLGNDLGDPLAPAMLLSDREIDMDGTGTPFEIVHNAALQATKTHYAGSHIEISGEDFTTPFFRVIGAEGSVVNNETICGDDGLAQLLVQSGLNGQPNFRINNNNTDLLDITTGLGVATFTANALQVVISIDLVNLYVQIPGGSPAAFNTAALQVQGSVTKRLFPQGQGAGTHNIDRDLDSAKFFTNSGAAVFALPNMVGSNNRPGFYFDVMCDNASGVTVDADAGVIIRFGSLVTSAGGTISTTEVGACVRVVLVDSTTWVAASFTGLWSLT
jgi:hypothetical protein